MRILLVLSVLFISFISCKKKPGEGGFATIQGKVYVKDYDAFYTYVQTEYYVPSETVYIIYGDGTEIGQTVKTSYDGSFKINYLRKGIYKIFVLGEDSANGKRGNPKEVLVQTEITKKKQVVTLPDFVILK